MPSGVGILVVKREERREMASPGEMIEPWKSTAATLFNPYLNLNQMSHVPRQVSIRTRVLTPSRHSRAPPETLIAAPVSSTPSNKRILSKPFPSASAVEDVSLYVQQMIHNQFCGRSGTPSDRRYDEQTNRRTKSTPNTRVPSRQTVSSHQHPSRVSDYELDHFFHHADEQMSRMVSVIPGRESSFSEHYLYSPLSRRSADQALTLAHMCDIASNVGDKMSQSKEKIGLEAIRGFRLPSARLTYEPYEHHPMDAPLVLGQHTPTEGIHLKDVLTDDNYSNEPMIEIVGDEGREDKPSRLTRHQSTPSASKGVEFKDWRGKITQPNLPDVRTRLRRDHSATLISPQRPCTAASNLSKSRPNSSGVFNNSSQKETTTQNSLEAGEELLTTLFKPSSKQRRARPFPLNVRIAETRQEELPPAPVLDPPALSLNSENNEENLRTIELMPRPTPDPVKSSSSTPLLGNTGSDETSHCKSYKFIASPSRQIYRTIPEPNSVPSYGSLQQLSLSQLELLENYDPAVSAKIGVPFVPLQILARPRHAQSTVQRSVQQIHRDYPKKNGQPVFEPSPSRSNRSLITVAQTLQLTQSKRVRVERQTTFERVETDSAIEETIQIKPLENPHRLELVLYSPADAHSLVKHTNSTRTSSKAQASLLDEHMISIGQTENDLSVVNLHTQQEVDQVRRRERISSKRPVFHTSIVTNANLNSPRTRPNKQQQQGRPIPSVFLTEDPEECHHSAVIYRQARDEVDIHRAFKGFVVQNLRRKLSAEDRERREREQRAAIRIQRAYRGHLKRRHEIELRQPPTEQWREHRLNHRRSLSAKRAQFVDQQLTEQSKIRDENRQYEEMIEQTGPSLRIFASFNQTEAQYSKATLNRAATCIQRWWRGFIVRYRWRHMKEEVQSFGLTWFQFSSRYRQVIERLQKMRQSEDRKFLFKLDQARDFLLREKKLEVIYQSLSFNDKLDDNELELFFERCDLSASKGEIEGAARIVLQHYPQKKGDSLTREMVFDIVYYIYPPLGTGLPSTRQSTWVRPIIDGEDETAIQGTPFLEPIDLNVIHKFLGKS